MNRQHNLFPLLRSLSRSYQRRPDGPQTLLAKEKMSFKSFSRSKVLIRDYQELKEACYRLVPLVQNSTFRFPNLTPDQQRQFIDLFHIKGVEDICQNQKSLDTRIACFMSLESPKTEFEEMSLYFKRFMKPSLSGDSGDRFSNHTQSFGGEAEAPLTRCILNRHADNATKIQRAQSILDRSPLLLFFGWSQIFNKSLNTSYVKGLEIARLLLDRNVPLNYVYRFQGYLPLHYAINRACPSASVRLLLESGADPNLKDFKEPPIHVAIRKKQINNVGHLIEFGACLSIKHDGKTPLLLAASTEKPSIKIIQKLCSSLMPTQLEAKDAFGDTSLHHLVRQKQYKETKFLLKAGANPSPKNLIGETPLHDAVRSKCEPILELLLEYGAGVDAVNEEGNTPLHIASEIGFHAAVEIILRTRANIMYPNNQGYTPLHVMIRCRNRSEGSQQRATSFALMVEKASYTIDAAINNGEHKGCTPLLLLALSCGGETYNDRQFINTLLEAGCRPSTENTLGKTPLHVASELGLDWMTAQFIIYLKQAGTCKATINKKDTRNKTPLHMATSAQASTAESRVETVRHLLKEGADKTMPDNEGKLPLHDAIQFGHIQLVLLLIPDIPLEGGNTPLHIAAHYGNPDIVALLLKNDGNPLLKNNEGKTPLQVSQRFQLCSVRDKANRHLEVAELVVLRQRVQELEERMSIGRSSS